MIALLNLFVLGFSFVFNDKAKRTQQGNLIVKNTINDDDDDDD